MSSLLRFTRGHPYRVPHWRWEQSRLVVEPPGGDEPPLEKPDDWVRRAVRLRKALRGAGSELGRARTIAQAGVVGLAYELWDHDLVEAPERRGRREVAPRVNPARYEMEARLLVPQESAAIGARMGVPAAAVDAYEALFFNVRDRLEQPSYVLHQVIGPSVQRGMLGRQGMTDLDFYGLLKAFAYFSGAPALVDALATTFLAPGGARPGTREEIFDFLAEDWRFTIKRKAVLAARAMPLNEFSQERLTEINAKLVEVETMAGGQDAAHGWLANVASFLRGHALGSAIPGGTEAKVALVEGCAAERRAGEQLEIATGKPAPPLEDADFRFPETPTALEKSSTEGDADA